MTKLVFRNRVIELDNPVAWIEERLARIQEMEHGYQLYHQEFGSDLVLSKMFDDLDDENKKLSMDYEVLGKGLYRNIMRIKESE